MSETSIPALTGQMVAQLLELLQKESNAHAETLSLLRSLTDFSTPEEAKAALDRLVVTDDGWRVMPE